MILILCFIFRGALKDEYELNSRSNRRSESKKLGQIRKEVTYRTDAPFPDLFLSRLNGDNSVSRTNPLCVIRCRQEEQSLNLNENGIQSLNSSPW